MSVSLDEIYKTYHYFQNFLEHLNGHLYIASITIGKHILNAQNEQLITLLITAINGDPDNTIVDYFNLIKSKLSKDSPCSTMPYYDFKDGYLLESEFNTNDFILALENIINKILLVYEQILNDKYDKFVNFAEKSIEEYIKKYDKENREMSCFEFLEIIFAKILKKNLNCNMSVSIFPINL